jgi:hypothetical protein
MNFCRASLGFSLTFTIGAIAAGCSSSDATPADAGSDTSTSQDSGSPGTDANAASDTGASSDAAPSDTGARGDAAIPSDTGAGSDGAVDGNAASSPDADAASDARTDALPSGDGGDAAAPRCGPFADGGVQPDGGDAGPSPMTGFFVSSDTSMTGNLGGLAGADARCQRLAAAVGLGAKTWHVYLSVEHDTSDGGSGPRNARDRIGAGPWYNSRGVLVAADLASLHARTGDPTIFIDEHGNMIDGQWTGSPAPLEHDILTGTNADGSLAVGKTCLDWTSAAPAVPADAGLPDGGELSVARVGHTDGLGPLCSMATTPNNVTSWNSAHDNAGCDNTAPRGGAGRVYCFATN